MSRDPYLNPNRIFNFYDFFSIFNWNDSQNGKKKILSITLYEVGKIKTDRA